MGVFLDQRRGFASTRLAGSSYSTDDDHHERWSTLIAASSLLRQGGRRLDDSVPAVCFLVVARVRRRQRSGAS